LPNVYLSEDYLIRLISQAVAALQVIAGLKVAQRYKEVGQQVDEALEGQFGLRASLLKELDDERLKEMLTTGGRLELERFLLVADLFRESAELAQRGGDEPAFRRDGQRALRFYRQALRDGGEAVDEKLPEKIAALSVALSSGKDTAKSAAASPQSAGGSSRRGIKKRSSSL
jgi:hypothetical protein